MPFAWNVAFVLLNERRCVESSEGARRGGACGWAVAWKSSKSCENTGVGVCLIETGGGSHVCC